jgi:putative phosphoesterase
MRIGLVSDTHVPEAEKQIPTEVHQALQGVDLILHAGDIYDLSVLDELERIAPLFAAAGDDDYGETLKDSRVKEQHNLELGGYTIWLVHQRPYQISTPWWRDQNLGNQNNNGEVPDFVIFGHEHKTVVEKINGVLLICPGSPTFLHYKRGLGTVGILELKSGRSEVHILDLSKLGE